IDIWADIDPSGYKHPRSVRFKLFFQRFRYGVAAGGMDMIEQSAFHIEPDKINDDLIHPLCPERSPERNNGRPAVDSEAKPGIVLVMSKKAASYGRPSI